MSKKYVKKNIVKKDKKIEFRVSEELHDKVLNKLDEDKNTLSKLLRHLLEVYTSV